MSGKSGSGSIFSIFKPVAATAKGAAKVGYEAVKKGQEALYAALPITTLATAYMVARILSPGGVRENVSDIVINNTEKANLIQSIRELERLAINKKLNSTAKPHDQFV